MVKLLLQTNFCYSQISVIVKHLLFSHLCYCHLLLLSSSFTVKFPSCSDIVEKWTFSNCNYILNNYFIHVLSQKMFIFTNFFISISTREKLSRFFTLVSRQCDGSSMVAYRIWVLSTRVSWVRIQSGDSMLAGSEMLFFFSFHFLTLISPYLNLT